MGSFLFRLGGAEVREVSVVERGGVEDGVALEVLEQSNFFIFISLLNMFITGGRGGGERGRGRGNYRGGERGHRGGE